MIKHEDYESCRRARHKDVRHRWDILEVCFTRDDFVLDRASVTRRHWHIFLSHQQPSITSSSCTYVIRISIAYTASSKGWAKIKNFMEIARNSNCEFRYNGLNFRLQVIGQSLRAFTSCFSGDLRGQWGGSGRPAFAFKPPGPSGLYVF